MKRVNNKNGRKVENWGLENELWLSKQLTNSKWLRDIINNHLDVNLIGPIIKIPEIKKADLIDATGIGIQVKASKSNYGQVKRCKISSFINNIPELKSIEYILNKSFTLPVVNGHCKKNIRRKRLTLENYNSNELSYLLKLFEINKLKILKDVFLGREVKYMPKLFIVIANSKTLIIWKTIDIINQLSNEKWNIGGNGTNLELESRTFCLQRKGGDSGRKTANNLQFKLRPCHLDRSKALVINF